MRLLQVDENGEFSLTKDLVNDIPPYAILSHTWGDDEEEVTFKDLKKGSGKKKSGHKKIQFCGAQASCDGLQYFWVDTCCINKSNLTELSGAINSMFRWYRDAAKCYVYLSDVSVIGLDPIDESLQLWEPAFRNSRWFTRGWTLQELIAPPSVEFFCSHGRRLGDKKGLEQQLVEITRIPASALRGTHLSEFPVNERMSWAETRTTHRAEDKAYSLLGIFDIYMSPRYGEGWGKESIRMLKKIEERPRSTPSDIVRSLDFRGILVRDQSIEKAYEGTFEWFLTDKRTGQQGSEYPMFSEWLRGPESLFWLSGKAGSGKSTLMKLIFHHPQLLEHLDHWASSAHCIKAGFFFFDQGSFPLQRSREGLLRSLMYQILNGRIELARKVFSQQWMNYKSQGASVETDWTWNELKQGFESLLTLFDKDLRLFLCIDGLDEYKRFSESDKEDDPFIDEDEYPMTQRRADDYQEILELLLYAARQPGVKICVSSRPLKIFEDAFLRLKRFHSTELHKISARDITLFVGNALGTNGTLRQMQYGSANLHSVLVKEIVEMAAGVFLWVRLVVNRVLTGVQNGDDSPEIMDKLKSLPPQLCGENGLFIRMLQEISTNDRQQAAEMFNLAQCARLSLTPLLLHFVNKEASVAIDSWTGKIMAAEAIEHRRDIAARRLASKCVGILEIADSPSSSQSVHRGSPGERPSPTIRFIHKTAKDLLAKQSVWTQLFPEQCRQHSQLDANTRLFIMYLGFIKAARGTPGEIDTVDAILEAIYFANRAEKSTGVALVGLLDELDRSMTVIWKIDPHYQGIRANTMNGSRSWHWLIREKLARSLSDLPWQDDFMSIAVQSQLSLYLETKLSSGAYKLEDKKGRPLLFYAAFPCKGQSQANPATTELLLKYGANPNEVFNGRSSWQLHLQWAYNSKVIERDFVWSKSPDGIRWAENTKLLVQYGANPNVWLWIRVSKGRTTHSPLFVVIDILRGNPKMRREVTLQLKKKGGYLYQDERAGIRSMYRLDKPVQQVFAEFSMRRCSLDEIDTKETYPKVWRHMEFKDMDELKMYRQDLEDLIAELGPEGKATPKSIEG